MDRIICILATTLSETDQHRSPIIIHQENVDPYRMLERLEKYEDSNDDRVTPEKKRQRLETPPIEMIKEDPSLDWYPARYRWPTEQLQFNLFDYRERFGHKLVKLDQDGDQREYCVPSVLREFSDRTTPWLHLLLYHAIDHSHLEAVDKRNAKRLKLSELIFFVNDISWLADGNEQSFDLKFTRIDENIYQLHRSEQIIGFALHALDIGDGLSTEVLLTAEKCIGMMLVRGYCLQPVQVNVTMEEALYDTESFVSRIGSSQDTTSAAIDFLRLPDKIFLDILSHIPWRERARCRRVDTRWAFVSDLALANDTKSILPKNPKFIGMKPVHFERLLPVVAHGLLELDLNGVMTPSVFAELDTVDSFRSLHRFVCTHTVVNYATLISILDKCPNLKSADIQLNWELSVVQQSRKFYNLESLLITDDHHGITDPVLISIADHFPKLSKFVLLDAGLITNSCLSSFVERYSNSLTYLKINCPDSEDDCVQWMVDDRIGVFDGIGHCQKLEYVSLGFTATIASDEFLGALSNGCKNLVTLDLSLTRGLTSDGFSSLAALPNLRRLNMNGVVGDFSAAFTTIALNGKLEQVLASEINLSVESVNACIKYCPNLTFLSVPSTQVLSIDNALEICTLYSRYGQSPRLMIRLLFSPVWKDQRVKEALKNIKCGNLVSKRRLLIDCSGRVEDDNDFLENGGDKVDLEDLDVMLDSEDETDSEHEEDGNDNHFQCTLL